MASGYYLKANGELPCWCHNGESLILGQVDRAWLDGDASDLLGLPSVVAIRQAHAEGRLPFPDVCPSCPSLGDGAFAGLRPEHLDRLQIEPSYLCGLDCPACLSPKSRLQLKGPPYYLDPALLESMLARLRRDGVQSVRLTHFEGRGDPLLHRDFPGLVRIVQRYFPATTTVVTTHGSYDFRPELLTCGLDVLRLSIDGATSESYARYRRGGDFERATAFLRAVRDRRRATRSRLQVVWKYILFEWNDSDAEITRAVAMADELEVRIQFVITESTGRSQRFRQPSDLVPLLDAVAPRAQVSGWRFPWDPRLTPELRLERQREVEGQLLESAAQLRQGDREAAARALTAALRLDPGLPDDAPPIRPEAPMPPAELMDRLIERVVEPGTLVGLNFIAETDGHLAAACRLLRRYLQIGPETAQREAFEENLIRLLLLDRLGSSHGRDFARCSPALLEATEREVLAVDPGHRPDGLLPPSLAPAGWMAEVTLPSTLRTLGFLRWARGDVDAACVLFAAYLEAVPGDGEVAAFAAELAEPPVSHRVEETRFLTLARDAWRSARGAWVRRFA